MKNLSFSRANSYANFLNDSDVQDQLKAHEDREKDNLTKSLSKVLKFYTTPLSRKIKPIAFFLLILSLCCSAVSIATGYAMLKKTLGILITNPLFATVFSVVILASLEIIQNIITPFFFYQALSRNWSILTRTLLAGVITISSCSLVLSYFGSSDVKMVLDDNNPIALVTQKWDNRIKEAEQELKQLKIDKPTWKINHRKSREAINAMENSKREELKELKIDSKNESTNIAYFTIAAQLCFFLFTLFNSTLIHSSMKEEKKLLIQANSLENSQTILIEEQEFNDDNLKNRIVAENRKKIGFKTKNNGTILHKGKRYNKNEVKAFVRRYSKMVKQYKEEGKERYMNSNLETLNYWKNHLKTLE